MIGVLFRLIYNLTIYPLALLLWAVRRGTRLRHAQALTLRLRKMPDAVAPGLLRRGPGGLADLGRHLDAAATNPRVTGLLLVLDGVSGDAVEFVELRALVDRFRRSGKPLHVHIEHTDWRTLAAVAPADRLSAAPAGAAMLHGIGIELVFFGDLLARHGVEMEVIRRGEYKGVMEPFVRREPSPPLAESLRALVDSVHDEVARGLAGRPGWDVARARTALDEGPYTIQRAVEIGLLDAVGHVDEAETALAGRTGGLAPGGRRRPATRAEPPKGARPRPGVERLADSSRVGLVRPRPAALGREPLIACVPVTGLILDRSMGGLGRRQAAIATRIAPRIRALADSGHVAAIVLVIDSRGGTVSGSDRIAEAVRYALGRKPVLAWMRSYAASGGYYIAAATQHIVASPFTVTGSIGVIASKPNVAGASAGLGINAVVIGRGRGPSPFSLFRPFDEATLAWMRAQMDEMYERFTRIVAEGRRMPPQAVEAVAQGRVWTGPQAHERDLVDRIGHYDDVMDAARELAGLRKGAGRIVWISPPEGLLHRLRRVAAAGRLAHRLEAFLDPALEPVLLARESPFLYYCPPLEWR